MTHIKNELKEAINLKVTEDLTVTVLTNSNHEFLMTTKEVANGYGINSNTLRSHVSLHKDEFIENKHFVKAVEIFNTLPSGVQPHQVYWTKQGVIRFGFNGNI